MRRITEQEWVSEGEKLFGELKRNWKFICPSCKTIQSGQDMLDLGIPKEEVIKYIGFSCVGRLTKEKGCDWTLGGFLQIHQLEVVGSDGTVHRHFEFHKPRNVNKKEDGIPPNSKELGILPTIL